MSEDDEQQYDWYSSGELDEKYEAFASDNISIKDIEKLHGADAVEGYTDWLYYNIKQEKDDE